MDQLLNKASSTLVTFAVRSGVQLASQYVAKTVGAVLEQVPLKEQARVARLDRELKSKVRIVLGAMETLQLTAIKGGTTLDEIVSLAKDLNDDIQEFDADVSGLIGEKMTVDKVRFLTTYMRTLINKIDSFVPHIGLVLAMSERNMSTKFKEVVSPNRLLNATAAMTASNKEFDDSDGKLDVIVGKPVSVTLYDVFYNNNVDKTDESFIMWQEKFTRANLTIVRRPDKNLSYVYDLHIVEDFDDGRYHDMDEPNGERSIDLRQIHRVFFSASGTLLKIEDQFSPVLVLKVNKLSKEELADPKKVDAIDPNNDENFTWLAIGDFEIVPDSDSEDEDPDSLPKVNGASPLALLEYILRLCALQTNDQAPIFKCSDERLMAYLEDETQLHSKPQSVPTLNAKLEGLRLE